MVRISPGVGDPRPEDCPYGADITGDGIQDTADFTALQQNFFHVGEAADGCTEPLPDSEPRGNPAGGLAQAKAGIRVADLKTRLPNAARADLTGDGLVDVRDIRAFARRHSLSLSPVFERKLERLEAARRLNKRSVRRIVDHAR